MVVLRRSEGPLSAPAIGAAGETPRAPVWITGGDVCDPLEGVIGNTDGSDPKVRMPKMELSSLIHAFDKI